MPPDVLQKNDPCHCGSERKYKHCCRAKDRRKADLRQGRGRAMLQWLLIAAVLSGAVYALSRGGGGPGPTAWQYDAATNRHWNPSHGHWHNGPPPAGR